jgi:hypothetical protein
MEVKSGAHMERWKKIVSHNIEFMFIGNVPVTQNRKRGRLANTESARVRQTAET